MNKIRTSIVTVAVAGGSVLGLAGLGGVVDAETHDAVPLEAVEQPADDDIIPQHRAEDRPDDRREDRREEGREEGRKEGRDGRRAEREAHRQAVADVLGLDVDDLREEMRGGATLAEVAEAQSVPISAVVDLIVEHKTAILDRAVESGRITAEEAAENRLPSEHPPCSQVREIEPRAERPAT